MRKWILLGSSKTDTNYFNITIGSYSDGDSNFGYNADPNDSNDNKYFGSLSNTQFYGKTILRLYARSSYSYNADMYLRYNINHYFTISGSISITSTLYIKRLDTNAMISLGDAGASYFGGFSWYYSLTSQTTENALFFRASDVGKTIPLYIGFENPS